MIYSNNRIFSLNEDAVITNVSEASMMDFVIEARRIDLEVFETVIGHDFQEAYNEHGMLALTEAEKSDSDKKTSEGIIKKLISTLKRLAEKLSNFVKSFGKKLVDIFKSNNTIYEKYKADFNKNVKTKEITVAKIGTKYESKIADSMKQMYDRYGKQIEFYFKTSTKVDNMFRDPEVPLVGINKDGKLDEDASNAKKRKLEPPEISEIIDVMKNKQKQPPFFTSIVGIITLIKNKHIVMLKKNATDKITDYESLDKLNDNYKITVSDAVKMCSWLFKECSVYNKHIAYCRKIFLQVARGQAEESAEESAAMDYCVGLASDIYMESVFAV